MPVYNAAEFVAECLDSILCQTFDNFELLIADDGSTDNTCDIISSYNDKRIKLFKRTGNDCKCNGNNCNCNLTSPVPTDPPSTPSPGAANPSGFGFAFGF